MVFALHPSMNAHLRRIDVFLALVTVGAVALWGDPSRRFFDVSCLLLFWTLYFGSAAGMWFYSRRRLQPALSKS
jgi:hypothetical protein